jgi:iron complex outermembrane receptor protein
MVDISKVRIAALASVAAQSILITPAAAQHAALPLSNEAAKPESGATNVSPAKDASDIIVTATRRAESLQKVPIAVTAIGQDVLRLQNIADTRDLARLVPALAFVGGATTKLNNFTVRGIGTYVFSDGFDQSVGVAFDGVSLARSGGSIADLVDIDRVEVLEGPQGMLFGKNASAGLVNIISRKPIIGVRALEGRMSYGNFNEIQTSATVNLPIGDDFALRASVWRFQHDGYVSAPTLGRSIGVKKSYGGRIRGRWQPTEGTDINITGEWTGADQDPAVTSIRAFATNALGIRDQETANGTPIGPANLVNYSPTPLYNKQKSSAFTLQIDQDIADHVLTSVTSYRKIAVRENFDPVSTNSTRYVSTPGDDVRYRQVSQELRVTSPAEQRLRYVFGGIYFRLDLDDAYSANTLGASPVFTSVVTNTDLRSEHYAVFGEATFDVFSGFRLSAGGRLSHDSVSGSLDRVYGRPNPVILAAVNGPGAPFGPYSYSAKVTADEPSWRVGMQYDVARDIMVYATVSRGYKGPGLDFQFTSSAATAAQTGLKVAPEIAHNYEAGVRAQLFDRRLTLNATAFYERFNGFQTSVRLPTTATLLATQNAKELKSTGVEGTFNLRAGGGITLSGAAAYIHARYTDFQNAACYPRQPTAPAGTPLQRGVCVNGVQSLNGYPLANSPRFSGNATVRYDGRLGSGDSVFLQANYRYQTKIVFNSVGDPYEEQGAYGVLNLAAGLRFQNDAIGLSAHAKNLFQKDFTYRTVPQLSGAYYAQIIPYDSRRTYGLALDFKF